jgi:hypothetical protein
MWASFLFHTMMVSAVRFRGYAIGSFWASILMDEFETASPAPSIPDSMGMPGHGASVDGITGAASVPTYLYSAEDAESAQQGRSLFRQ